MDFHFFVDMMWGCVYRNWLWTMECWLSGRRRQFAKLLDSLIAGSVGSNPTHSAMIGISLTGRTLGSGPSDRGSNPRSQANPYYRMKGEYAGRSTIWIRLFACFLFCSLVMPQWQTWTSFLSTTGSLMKIFFVSGS